MATVIALRQPVDQSGAAELGVDRTRQAASNHFGLWCAGMRSPEANAAATRFSRVSVALLRRNSVSERVARLQR